MFKSLLIYIVIVLLELLVIASVFEESFVLKQVQSEQAKVESLLGREQAVQTYNKATDLYTKIFMDTHIVQTSFEMLVPSKEEIAKSQGMENIGNDIFPAVAKTLRSFWTGIFHSIYRLVLMQSWGLFFAAIFIPAIIDGLMRREVKKHTYGYASPVRYHASMHFLVFMLAAIPFYMFFPFTVTPLLAPLWGIVFAVALITLTSNIQRKI